MKKSELVEKAAEAIETYGWTTGTMGSEKMGFCLLGAGKWALFGEDIEPWNSAECARVEEAINPGLPIPLRNDLHSNVTRYNDQHINTKEEAVDTLITAAKYWRNKGE